MGAGSNDIMCTPFLSKFSTSFCFAAAPLGSYLVTKYWASEMSSDEFSDEESMQDGSYDGHFQPSPAGPQRQGSKVFKQCTWFDLTLVLQSQVVTNQHFDEAVDLDSQDETSEGDAASGSLLASSNGGGYNAQDYMNLEVSDEIRELFQYITRYKPQVRRSIV